MNHRMKSIIAGAAPLMFTAGALHTQANAADTVRSDAPSQATQPASQPATQPAPAPVNPMPGPGTAIRGCAADPGDFCGRIANQRQGRI